MLLLVMEANLAASQIKPHFARLFYRGYTKHIYVCISALDGDARIFTNAHNGFKVLR
jgi:hypothetical protein